jgi:hypothetical protein
MNCTVCGNPLIFDRVVFHCSCDAFVHAYCWDEHVLEAHRPRFEMGSVTLDGEFVPRETEKEKASIAQLVAGAGWEEEPTPLSE